LGDAGHAVHVHFIGTCCEYRASILEPVHDLFSIRTAEARPIIRRLVSRFLSQFFQRRGTSPGRRMIAPPPIASGAPRRCAIRCVSPLPPRLPICLAPTQQRASGVTPFRQPVLHFTEAVPLTPLPEKPVAIAPIWKGQDRRRVMQPIRRRSSMP